VGQFVCEAANLGRSRLSGGQSRLKAGCRQNFLPTKASYAKVTPTELPRSDIVIDALRNRCLLLRGTVIYRDFDDVLA
jgi:hypothetical protein